MDKQFFENFRLGDYQRENFDAFLKAIHFSYSIPSIHVAGTNGKGSTSSYIASIFSENGYKTGLFRSPFLLSPNEMISINQKEISDEDFSSIFEEYKKQISKFDLSAFEIQTFVALTYFERNKCDVAVIECGMGGEIDATNIFVPILSIITSISLEHTDFLGYSISEIASQKAGIIKEEVPVLVGDLSEDAMTVILKTAKNNDSKVCYLSHYVNEQFENNCFTFDYGEYRNIKINSPAKYSIDDCVLAIEAISLLKDRYPLTEEKVLSGIWNNFMPCRMDIIKNNPMVILDGAHNPEAMAKLCESHIYVVTQNKPIHVIFACFRDKNLGNMLASLGAITDDLTITTFNNPRARTQDEYFLFADDYPFEENALELINRKINEFPDDAILITGSLAFSAYVKKLFLEGKIK